MDSCRRAYFEEKLKTSALNEQLSRLRSQLDSLQSYALRNISAPDSTAHPAQVRFV